MSPEPRFRVPDYLRHILQAVERIERYTAGMDEAAFSTNELAQDACIRNFEIIGEACHRIQREHPSFAAKHPDLPLASAYEMRNFLAHGYFSIRLKTVWDTIQDDLPGMKQQVEDLLRDLKDGSTV